MIKIVKGSYGLREGKTVKPVKAGDAPISLDKEQEARLVKLGVAVYVNADASEKKAKKSSAAKAKETPAVEEETPAVEEEELPELNAEEPVENA